MPPPNRLEGIELERKVRDWLQQQSPPLHFVEAEKGDDPDFRILRPVPMAVLAMAVPSLGGARMKAKRLLAHRIELAERFGAHMPVVVVISGDANPEWIRFADKVLIVNDLPAYADMAAKVQLNPEVQRILSDGDPGDVTFSTEADIQEQWKDSLWLSDLGDNQRLYPEGSLAWRLSEAMRPFKNAAHEPDHKQWGVSSPKHAGLRSGIEKFEDGRPDVPWYLSPRCSEAIDREIFKFIEQRCGGHVDSKRSHERLLEGQVIRNVWNSKKGIRVVIRRQSVSVGTSSQKAKELLAEAWMTRALLKPRVDRQVLLFTMAQELSSPAMASKAKLPRLFELNKLEAAGWLVAPWDFAQDEPHFIQFLKGVDQ
jgi:hypothetical protein